MILYKVYRQMDDYICIYMQTDDYVYIYIYIIQLGQEKYTKITRLVVSEKERRETNMTGEDTRGPLSTLHYFI